MARRVSTLLQGMVMTALAWTIAFLIFFPILWMILTSFKTRARGVLDLPPKLLVLRLDDENYAVVQARSDYVRYAMNSVILAGGSTLARADLRHPGRLGDGLSLPTRRTQGSPLVDAVDQDDAAGRRRSCRSISSSATLGLLDTPARPGRGARVLANLPIVVWMLFTYFKEIPKDILEAARMDGATSWKEIVFVLAPMALPGIASTVLLNVILAWNEAFWTLNLTTIQRRAAHRSSSPPISSARRGCSGPSCRPPPRSPSRPSWSSAGSASGSSCAA